MTAGPSFAMHRARDMKRRSSGCTIRFAGLIVEVWRECGVSKGTRTIPDETAHGAENNGGTYAVMMGDA